MFKAKYAFGVSLGLVLVTTFSDCGAREAAPSLDSLERSFLSPPQSARPRVWWHWLDGNVSIDGIKLDLEWMRRIGIGGVQVFDASFATPQVVSRRLLFGSSEWRGAFHYAVETADRLEQELAIAGSPGWSESGGPWVQPEDSMKKLVWAEVRVQGGTRVTRIPALPAAIGPFQDITGEESIDRKDVSTPAGSSLQAFARDIAVVAYRLPDNDRAFTAVSRPRLSTSVGEVDGRTLQDERFATTVSLPFGTRGHEAWIRVDFGHPVRVQSMTVGLEIVGSPLAPKYCGAILQSSDDGRRFRKVATAYDSSDNSPQAGAPAQETISFPPVSARFFRLILPAPPADGISPAVAPLLDAIPTKQRITKFILRPVPYVNHFEKKAGYFLEAGLASHPTPHVRQNDVVRVEDVINVSKYLRGDGKFEWTPPSGNWAILRVGYSLLGVKNHPAAPEGTGLEVDKLDGHAVKSYMDRYLGLYQSVVGPFMMGSRGIRALVSDSYESGPQNWTGSLDSEFSRRRRYDMGRWLPVLTGRIVASAEKSDKFLWDFRRTLAELMAENHYGQITKSLHARGMLHYGESHEISRAFIGDGMDVRTSADVPMGAMWVPGSPISQEQGDADIREAASVAHIFGQKFVGAESMTALGRRGTAYGFAPDALKATVDRELVDGLNLFMIHTSVHQPLPNGAPGPTLGFFGQWFTRNETWAEMAGPWITYLARSSYLLQQGQFAADVLYFYGQDSNITAVFGSHLPPIPAGYAFDFASAQTILRLTVKDGRIIAPSGASYRVLVLDPRARVVSLDVLKQIAALVSGGAVIIGDKPQDTPSLADSEAEFRSIANALWGSGRGEKRYGRGRVFSYTSLRTLPVVLGVGPDFSYTKSTSNTTIWFVHHRLEDGDIYFLSNRRAQSEKIDAHFRVTGRIPELWHADSGEIEPVSFRQDREQTSIKLTLDQNDAVFVVFRKTTNRSHGVDRVPVHVCNLRLAFNQSWRIHFQAGRGAPERADVLNLESLSESPIPGIRYFSGVATYETTFEALQSWSDGPGIIKLDLGRVRNVAEIILNGRSVGIVWRTPYRIPVSGSLVTGTNHLAVRVANLWPNRLIGDKQPNARQVANTPFNPYTADSPLLPSGLLGPVSLLQCVQRERRTHE